MRAEIETTRPMQRAELSELVAVVGREPRITARMPAVDLGELLQRERDLATAIIVAPADPEVTARIRPRPRKNLIFAFASAAAAGMLVTAPLWW